MTRGRAKLKDMGLVPLALDREEAAAYVGMSVRAFAAAVAAGTYPQPMPGPGKRRWNRVALEAAHGVKGAGGDSIMGAIDEARSKLRGQGQDVSLFPRRQAKGQAARRA